LNISEFEDENWVQKVEQNHSFEDYNPLGAISAEHSYTIDFQTLENIEDVITKIGSYQVYIDIQDAAGNQSRVIFYFTITSASVDAMKSTFEI